MSRRKQKVEFVVVNADLRSVYTTSRELSAQRVDNPPPGTNQATVVIRNNLVIPPNHQVAVILYCTWLMRRQFRTLRRYRAMKKQSLHRRRAFLAKMRHRNRLFFFTMIVMQLLRSMHAERRRIWRLPRSAHWWNTAVMETFTDEQWLENFRMTRETFHLLCNFLRPYMERASTRLRIAIPLEQRMGMAVFRLASGQGLRAVEHLFGASKASVCLIFRDFTKAVVENLLPQFLRFPQGDRLEKVVRGFEQKWGFPQCVGVVGGTHIPVTPSAALKGDYLNQGGWCSMHAQCVVDHQLLFTDVFVGWPGRLHEAKAFQNSPMYMEAEGRAPFFPAQPRLIRQVEVPQLLVGDASYPLKAWLMTPYPAPAREERQRGFNGQLSKARMVVEIALGRLKGRWRLLLKTAECSIHSVPDVVLCCCVLHNVCELWGERFLARWREEVLEEEKNLQREQPQRQQFKGKEDGNAQVIRNALADFLTNQY